MDKKFDLEEYLAGGVKRLMKEILIATAADPKESAFMVRFSAGAAKAARVRKSYNDKGRHIPPFLIASITSKCNLHCAGCYARANNSCHDEADPGQLSAEEWDRVFSEAGGIGISFILLAGGEPMIRRDVIKAAAEHKNILFPVFTNGTMINDEYFELIDANRNIFPVFSIEGDENITDTRRGKGIYKVLEDKMGRMREKGLLFGASVTVTKENCRETTDDSFIEIMRDRGCKAVFYVEYVPVSGSDKLAPDDEMREYLAKRIAELREKYPEMVFISFPGDEKSSGGCLAAGRGFFHINAGGGAEPCPFSPYSDSNVRDMSLLEIMDSKLFNSLRSGGILTGEHSGGCVLFEHRDEVEGFARQTG